MPRGDDWISLSLKFPGDQPIGALDLSAFLFDLNRLYVIAYKAEQNPAQFVNFRGYGRNSFRIPKRAQLSVHSLRFESPLLVIFGAAIASAPAVWSMLQMIEKVKVWPLQQEKLRLEVEKVRLEVIKLHHDVDALPAELAAHAIDAIPDAGRRRRGTRRERIEPILDYPIARSAINQLSLNPLKPIELTVDVEPEKTGVGLAPIRHSRLPVRRAPWEEEGEAKGDVDSERDEELPRLA
jgi:hypothetical protein